MTENTFSTTRKRQCSSSAEDYTELVADLLQERGVARVGVIASTMGISHVTALRTIQRLEKEDYLKRGNDRTIKLTAKGKRTAAFAKHKHLLLLKFLRKIGVPEEIARNDVEGMEHFISRTTLKAIAALCDHLDQKVSTKLL